MAPEAYSGQRLSYDDHLCTVRYKGPVDGTSGLWLGVEWDNPTRGKHDGSRGGKKYFDCLSKEPKAASFIRVSKPSDPPRDFLTALGVKYGSKDAPNNRAALKTIFICGKEVKQVGFHSDRHRLMEWPTLRIISLDGLRLNGICPDRFPAESRGAAFEFLVNSLFQCEALDLSRNLFETWEAVLDICSALEWLRYLNLRFKDLRSDAEELEDTFKGLETLSLANTALDWHTSLAVISHLPSRFTLVLRSNPLATLSTDPQLVFRNVTSLDLTSTLLAKISNLSPIPKTFPLLDTLQTSQTPLATSHSSSRLLTIAYLPALHTLNNTRIPDHERLNAEIYYHKIITSLLLAAETPEQDHRILSEHPQWLHLCGKYGEPESIQAKHRVSQSPSQQQEPDTTEQTYPPISLGANLCTFTFTFHTTTTTTKLTITPPQPRNLQIDALGIILRFPPLERAVQRDNLVPQDIFPGSHARRDRDGPRGARFAQLIRAPVARGRRTVEEARLGDLGEAELGFVDGGACAVAASQVVDDGPVVGFGPGGPLEGECVAGGDGDGGLGWGGADVADDVRVGVFGGLDGAEVSVLRGGPAGDGGALLLPGV
ncbi:MAG: hypothetical protein Q9216_006506 [Gyalolechia sp. 2 TL-2023]